MLPNYQIGGNLFGGIKIVDAGLILDLAFGRRSAECGDNLVCAGLAP